jgi:hypothetical protein
MMMASERLNTPTDNLMDGFIKSIDSFLKFNRLEKHIKFSVMALEIGGGDNSTDWINVPSKNCGHFSTHTLIEQLTSGLLDRILSLYTSLLTKSEGTKNIGLPFSLITMPNTLQPGWMLGERCHRRLCHHHQHQHCCIYALLKKP